MPWDYISVRTICVHLQRKNDCQEEPNGSHIGSHMIMWAPQEKVTIYYNRSAWKVPGEYINVKGLKRARVK